MITNDEALAWAVREGISRAGGSMEDTELFAQVLGEVHKIATEPPPPPSRAEPRTDTPTSPTIKVTLNQKATLIALSLLLEDGVD